MMTEIGFAAKSRVITMGMGDHSFINRLPWINIEIACTAIQALIREFDQQEKKLRNIFIQK